MTRLKRRLKFTDAWIKTAKPETYTDIVQTGLRLRISPRGLRTFFHLYRLHGVGEIGKRGKRGVGGIRKDALGHYPDLTLEDARKLVKETRAKITAKDDPRQPPPVEGNLRTFEEVAVMAMADWTRTTFLNDIQKRVIPLLGDRPISQITRSEIAGLLDKVHDPKSPTREQRVLDTLKKIFEFADKRGYLDEGRNDPTLRMDRKVKPPVCSRVLSLDELEKIWTAAGQLPGHGPAQRLIMLTGGRRTETSKARWEDIDLDEAVWVVPWQNRKNGSEEIGDHTFYLPAQAVALLAELRDARAEDAGPFVFSTTGGRQASDNWTRFKKRVDEKSGVTGWRTHDLRHTIVSGMATLGIAPHICSVVVSHSLGKSVSAITAGYMHGDFAGERREALQRWANHIRPPADDKVVRLSERRVK